MCPFDVLDKLISEEERMKKNIFSVLLLVLIFCAKDLRAQDLSKNYQILSVFYNVPDDDQKDFETINFRYGWTNQAPYSIAIQFTNAGYSEKKLKFAIKDVTSNQMILLDPVHNVYFGTETLKANSDGAVWAGPIDNLKDSFALRVWDSDGDAFDQEPISILSEWAQKPINTQVIITNQVIPSPTTPSTPTPTQTLPQNAPVSIGSAKIGASNGTPGTSEGKLTNMPTATTTPIPVFNCTYLAIGDSYTSGEGASCPASAFASLTYETLKNWYPGIKFELDGNMGAEPYGWVLAMPDRLERYAKKDGLPIEYVMFQTGTSCFVNVYNAGNAIDHNGDDHCKGASLSQGVSYSYNYQKRMDTIIGDIYAFNPNVNLVVLGIPDSSGGTGRYAPSGVYEAYRQRLYELKVKYPKMRIADVYRAMKGHPEYFKYYPDFNHPDDQGQTVIAKCVLEQFKDWPYKPSKH
jgi:hypothetical protein